jgi:hypothetical protein
MVAELGGQAKWIGDALEAPFDSPVDRFSQAWKPGSEVKIRIGYERIVT